jgi:hypothetical protein
MGAGGMSERHIDAEGERRLMEAGFLPEESHVGKRRWKDPDTVDPTLATCTLVGPPTTCTRAGIKGEGRIVTTAEQFQTCGFSIYPGPHGPY